METEIAPVVIGALGSIPKNLHLNSESLAIEVHVLTLQKSALLDTANILPKVLSVCGHWLDRDNNLWEGLQYQRLLWEVEDNNNYKRKL